MTSIESNMSKFMRGELEKSPQVFTGKTCSGKEVTMRVVIDSLKKERKDKRECKGGEKGD